jgi:hypothetical protein
MDEKIIMENLKTNKQPKPFGDPDDIKYYIHIKRYPGGPNRIGEVMSSMQIPGHQWPDYWKELTPHQVALLDKKQVVQKELDQINQELFNELGMVL